VSDIVWGYCEARKKLT